jgi:malonate-semialdehyde dehydrogenase (acetylating)/methylmalonate-semialdehyde dehydrogenase
MATTTTRILSNYVGGRWTESESSELLDVTNPRPNDVIARVPLSTPAELDAAVAAARAALPAWRAVAVPERARRLFALREKLVARQEDLARSVTMEMGKTLPDARAEVGRMIEMVEAACAVPTTMQGRIIEDVARNVDAETVRQPVGVCAGDRAVQLPGDGAVLVPARSRSRAATRSCSSRPSRCRSRSRWRSSRSTSSTCPTASSTSSTATARSPTRSSTTRTSTRSRSSARRRSRARLRAAAARGKRVQALGGAKNHMVVMPDAVLDKTVSGLLGSAFGAAGQRCMAGSVVVAVGDAPRALASAARGRRGA